MPIPLTQLINTLLADDAHDKGLLNLDPSGSFMSRATPSDVISGGNVLIWVGPPLELQAKRYPKYLKPVGTCTAVAMQEARNWLTTSEFGEQHYYKLPGKIQITLSLSRVQTATGDFYKTFYQWLQVHWNELKYNSMTWSEVPSISDGTDLYAQSVGAIQGKAGNNFFVTSNQIKNPSSELMMMPFGLLIAQYDQAYNIVKKQYAENCRILNRSDSRNPQSAMVEESGQISPFKIVATTIDIGFKKKIEFEIASTP